MDSRRRTLMLLVLCFSTVLASQDAFTHTTERWPNVGDQAKYRGSGSIDGEPVQHRGELKLLEFDQSKNQFLQELIIVKEGQPSEKLQSWISASVLMSEEKAKYMLSVCEDRDGVLETVTVPAGTFETCRFSNDKGEHTYMGKVPFGVVKIKGNDFGIELTEVTFGSTM